MWRAQQLRELTVLVANCAGQRQRRKIRGLSHADAGVGCGHAPFGSGNVGATLQQLRRQSGRHAGHLQLQRLCRQLESGRRLAQQNGDGVFQTRTLPIQIQTLCLRRVQLRFGLHHIAAPGHAGCIAVAGDFQCALIFGQTAFIQPPLSINNAQLQIVLHQHGLSAEQGRLQISRAGSKQDGIGFHTAPDAPPQIRFPSGGQRHAARVLRVFAGFRTTTSLQAGVDIRPVAGLCCRQAGQCLLITGCGHAHRLVVDHNLLDQRIQLRIAKLHPPRAHGGGAGSVSCTGCGLRGGGLPVGPGCRLFIRLRHVDCRAHIIRADSTAAQTQAQARQAKHGRQHQRPAPPTGRALASCMQFHRNIFSVAHGVMESWSHEWQDDGQPAGGVAPTTGAPCPDTDRPPASYIKSATG